MAFKSKTVLLDDDFHEFALPFKRSLRIICGCDGSYCAQEAFYIPLTDGVRLLLKETVEDAGDQDGVCG